MVLEKINFNGKPNIPKKTDSWPDKWCLSIFESAIDFFFFLLWSPCFWKEDSICLLLSHEKSQKKIKLIYFETKVSFYCDKKKGQIFPLFNILLSSPHFLHSAICCEQFGVCILLCVVLRLKWKCVVNTCELLSWFRTHAFPPKRRRKYF